jgi:hypothetical protein
MELIRKAWSSFKETLKRMMQVFSRAFREASITGVERRSEYAVLAYPISKVWSVPISDEFQQLREDVFRILKRYNKLILRLEGIRRRTRKARIKKKLGKRIDKLRSMNLVTKWGCRLDC